MSFFGSLFHGDKLSDRSQIHFDLAKIYLAKGRFVEALASLDKVARNEQDSDPVLKLRNEILRGLEQSERESGMAEGPPREVRAFDHPNAFHILRFDALSEDRLRPYTEDGYEVEAVCHGDGQWVVVLRLTPDRRNRQKYVFITGFHNDTFAEHHAEGLSITQVASDGTLWFFVLDERPDWEDQLWVYSPNEYPQAELERWERDGLFIHTLFEHDNTFFICAVRTQESVPLERFESKTPPTDAIDRVWDEDKWLERLFWVKGRLIYVYGDDSSVRGQNILTHPTFPQAALEEKLREGHVTEQILHGPQGWIVISGQDGPEGDHAVDVDVSGEAPARSTTEDHAAVLAELDALVGLRSVKQTFHELVDFLRIGRIKESQGIDAQDISLHMVFTGNPGTGKTTVARLAGRVFKSLGLLSKGHLVETDRAGLVGQHIGETAQKTSKLLDEAKGGILFVDEAYALHSESGSDFGAEALETIIKRMEDDRDDLAVIFAGYPDEMRELVDGNPGIESRFGTHLVFEDFSPDQLVAILKKMLVRSSHFLTPAAETHAIRYFTYLVETADRSFGNAREVRNLFEDLLKSQSSRLAKQVADDANSSRQLTYEELRCITLHDLRACYQPDYEEEREETLDDILDELDQLIGLDDIKRELVELAHYIDIMKRRAESGLPTDPPGLHAVFTGSPGTGKTTVARLLARIYKSLGLIKKDVLVEVSRKDLVAEYVGQTAVKTDAVIDRAMHGVLFIDEAYALAAKGEDDFGQEAIATLLKRMEDDRDDLVVIVAGYPGPMRTFLESNPGLPSRFDRIYHFPDFSEDQLCDIFRLFVRRSSYALEPEANDVLAKGIRSAMDTKSNYFGNARWVRKLFEASTVAQALRLSTNDLLTESDLQLITADDLNHGFDKMRSSSVDLGRREIGFRE